jgi:hypothetical protein
MDKRKEITIYGCGMSGLVAAINLAREGHSVTVHDKESGYGGDTMYNPSTHCTPIDRVRTSDYIGIDITPVFYPLIACPFYLHDTRSDAPHSGLYSVERGNRPTSLDTLLYGIARKEGVSFEFNSPLKKNDIIKMPPDTIIACGLTPGAYDMLEVPSQTWYGWVSRGEAGFSDYSRIWWDECITEYGYLSSANNYYFDLLFSIKPVTREALEKYKTFLRRNEGLEYDNWEYVKGAVPVARSTNPRLFHNGMILCGTISGYIDPFGWFGIAGALISGKIAAMAVTDNVKAQKEFDRFIRYYRRVFYFKKYLWYTLLRPRVELLENLLVWFGPEKFSRLVSARVNEEHHLPFSIPAFAHLGAE